jgi:hypothetical protein
MSLNDSRMTHMRKELRMKTILMATTLFITLMLAGLATAQSPTMIFACVDAQGRPRIIPQGTSCENRETLLTWPATPTTPTSFYEKFSVGQPMMDGSFSTAIALCDDPDDTATGGGHTIIGLQAADAYGISISASCRAGGLCAGPAGQDGWIVTGSSRRTGTVLTAYVVCAK